jgi:hypothetical protein
LAPLLPSALRKPLFCHECPTPPFDCPRRPPPTPPGRRRPPRKLCCPCGRSAPSMVCVRTECAPMLSAYPVPLVDRLVSNSPRLKERLASEAMVADRRQGRRHAGEPAPADIRQLPGFVSVARGEGLRRKVTTASKIIDRAGRFIVARRLLPRLGHFDRPILVRADPAPRAQTTRPCAPPGRNRRGARSSPGQSTSGLSLR